MDYIAQPKDYWIAQGAITITLNALGNPNRTQGSVASGAAILCYIEGVDGLGYDNGHRFKTWPLSLSPTYFNSNTQKYVYAAIPRTATAGTLAVIVFPSEKLDVYGKNSDGAQVGSSDYYYIWLQGIISSSGDYGTTNRTWTEEMDFGKKGTDEDLYDDTDGEWYQYSKVSGLVTFLKNIQMKAGTTFHNLYLGYKELTGVATGATSEEYVDSETLVVTPSYLQGKYLSRQKEDVAQEQIGFLKGIWIGIKGLYEITADGIAKFKSLFVEDITAQRMQVDDMQSSNYTGDGIADTGWRLTKDYNGHSKLTVDELYVRMKAVFESLEVKKELVSGGNQVQSCAASVISKVDYLDANKDILGYDEYKVPFTLRNAIMMLFKGQNPFGSYSRTRRVRLQLTAADRQNVRYVRCYFLAKEGERKIQNWWRVADPNDNSTGNDMARCQTFNLASDSISERDTYFGANTQKQGNIFWWRKVAGVSTTPVEIDGKEYHYFDVYCNPTAEAATPYSYSGAMEGSDIPAPGDEVSQWGNDNNIDRMNLIVQEVNGQDAAIKMYEGINQFSMETGLYGNPLKIRFAPKTGCKVHTTKWEVVTETFIAPIPVECGNWSDITPVQGQRTARYYEIYQHNGGSWLCVASNGGTFKAIEAFSTYAVGDTITQTAYDALTVNQQMCCARVSFGTTTDEPSTTSAAWRQYAAKGDPGVTYYTHVAWASAVTLGTTPSGHTTTGQTTTPNATRVTGFDKSPFTGAAWMGILVNTVASDSDDGLAYTWKKVEGPQGEDAVSIVVSPASLIVNQDLNYTTNLSNLTEKFVVRVYKGSAEHGQELTVNGLSFVAETVPNSNPTAYKCLFLNGGGQRSGNSNIAGNELTLKEIRTYTQDGKTLYYDSMFVDVTATYNTNKTIKARVRIYANLLGTWGEEVVGDAKTEVAKSLSYAYDPSGRNVVSLENMGKFIKSSTQDTTELRQKVYDDILNLTYPATSSSIDGMTVNVLAGTYKVTGEFNIANLPTGNGYLTFEGPGVNKTWDLTGGLVDSIDDEVTFTSDGVLTISADDDIGSGSAYDILNLAIYQSQDKITKLELTADGLTSDVKAIKAGKNLLTLTSGWEGYGGAAVNYDKKNFGVWDESSDLYSPFIRLAEGQSVCFSAYMSSYAAQSGNWCIGYGSTPPVHLSDLYDNARIPIALTKKTGDSITVDGTTYDRYYYVLNAGTVFVDQYITFNFADLYKLFCPQLENGNAPTAFTAGSIETSSQIKQTADGITSTVHGEMAGSNINLLYGVDGYTASNKLLHKSSAIDGFIEYKGNGTPHIFTSVQLIKGCTYTIQCVTDGTIASSHESNPHNPSSKLCTIWLRMDGSLNGGYNGEVFTSSRDGYQNLGSGRHKWTFVCQKTGEYWFRTNSYSDGTTEVTINFWNIKLEGGYTATDWSISTSQMTSQIKQTADKIQLFVTDGLDKTGINITNGTIDLTAAKIVMSSGGQGQTIVEGGKIKADYINAQAVVTQALTSSTITANNATINNIKLGNAEVSGKITATSGSLKNVIVGPEDGDHIEIGKQDGWGNIVGKNADGESLFSIYFSNGYPSIDFYKEDSNTNEWSSLDYGELNIQKTFNGALDANHLKLRDDLIWFHQTRNDSNAGSFSVEFDSNNKIKMVASTYLNGGDSAWPVANLNNQYGGMTSKGYVHSITLLNLKTILNNTMPSASYANMLSKCSLLIIRSTD